MMLHTIRVSGLGESIAPELAGYDIEAECWPHDQLARPADCLGAVHVLNSAKRWAIIRLVVRTNDGRYSVGPIVLRDDADKPEHPDEADIRVVGTPEDSPEARQLRDRVEAVLRRWRQELGGAPTLTVVIGEEEANAEW
jgi:hypothetical protein